MRWNVAILWTFMRLVAFVTCLACFVLNSYAILLTFFDEATVTTSDFQLNSKLLLPAITFCRSSGFKHAVETFKDLELDNYLNNTLRRDEFLLSIDDHNSRTLFNSSYQAKSILISVTYSAYKGRCYTFEYTKEVKTLIQ